MNCLSTLISLSNILSFISGSTANYNIPFMYFCSKSGDGDKKVCNDKDGKSEQEKIKSHPANSPKVPSSLEHGLKLKECKPVAIDPCRPPPIGPVFQFPCFNSCFKQVTMYFEL